MTLRSLLPLFCLALLVPTASFAQSEEGSPASMEDRPALKLNQVERGVFFGVNAGWGVALAPKSSKNGGLSTGRSIGLTLGTDIGERLSVSLLAMGLAVDTPSGFVPASTVGSGDFGTLVLGGVVQFALLGTPDSNGINRFFAHVRAGGGLGLMDPKKSFEGNEMLAIGGAGVQYFTRLRRFSVGLDADLLYGVNHLGAGMMLSPNVRYTF